MSELMVGKQYIVWNAYTKSYTSGYYLGESPKAVISWTSQSWYTPMYAPGYSFSSTPGRSATGKKANVVPKDGFVVLCCLSDIELPKRDLVAPE